MADDLLTPSDQRLLAARLLVSERLAQHRAALARLRSSAVVPVEDEAAPFRAAVENAVAGATLALEMVVAELEAVAVVLGDGGDAPAPARTDDVASNPPEAT